MTTTGDGRPRGGEVMTRDARISGVRGSDDGERRLELTWSSEEPVERSWGVEILDHDPGSVRLDWLASGRAPLLVDHRRDAAAQIGVVERAWIGDDRRGHAVVRLGASDLADLVWRDVESGVRGSVSVGYRIHRVDESGERDDGTTVYRVTKWEPVELSIVTVPADMTVGVGRSDDWTFRSEIMVRKNDDTSASGGVEAETDAGRGDDTPAAAGGDAGTGTQVRAGGGRPSADELARRAAEEAQRAERRRVADIMALAERHNMRDLGEQAVRDGWSVGRMQAAILDRYGEQQPVQPVGDGASIGIGGRDLREYSILRAVRAMVTGDWSDAQLEREASDQVARQIGSQPSGIYVPTEVQDVMASGLGQRDVQVATTGGGLVGTDHMAGRYIDYLRARLVVHRAGATVMSGLVGDVDIPRQATGADAGWLGTEDADAPVSEPAFDAVLLRPHTAAAHAVISRQLALQSSPDAEQMVRRDLMDAAAAAIDRAAIAGTGAGGQPTGILSTTGVAVVSAGGALTWAHVVRMETEVAASDADVGSLAYITNPRVAGALKTTPMESGQAVYVWRDVPGEPGRGMIGGYSAYTSSLVPDAANPTGPQTILFGNFRDLIIGEWGAMEVAVDPYTLQQSGRIRLTVFRSVDVAVRHPASFSAIVDATV